MSKWLFLAWRNVGRNTRRSLLAGGIIAFGAVALLVMSGFVLASFHGLREATIHSDLGHIQIAPRGGFDPQAEALPGLTPETVAAVRAAVAPLPSVRFLLPRVLFEGLASTGSRTVAVVARGVDPALEARLSTAFATVAAGQPLDSSPTADPFQALPGLDLAAALGGAPGQSLTLLATMDSGALNALDLAIRGTLHTGIPEQDARVLLLPLPAAQELLGSDRVTRLVVALSDTATTDSVAAHLRESFPDLDIRTWADLAPFYGQVVTLYRNLFTVLGVIVVAMVLLAVTNSLLMTVLERVREVGTLRAMGFSQKRLAASFALEGAVIGGLGGAVGLVLAAGLSLGITAAGIEMPPPPGRTSPYPLMIFLHGPSYAGVLGVMVLCGTLAAWLSALTAVRKPIVEALGHD